MRITAVLAALALAACTDSATAPLDGDIVMKVGETVSIEGANLSLKFLRVASDSRCPIDVVCAWAGNGQVDVEARNGGLTTPVTLNTLDGAKEVVVGGYRIMMRELTPVRHANDDVMASAYRLTLSVQETQSGAVCTTEARASLNVALADSATGATTGFTSVKVVARDGAYADSAAYASYPGQYVSSIPLAYERKGTYDITVTAAGYQPWTRNGVVVTADECHVAGVSLTARLVR